MSGISLIDDKKFLLIGGTFIVLIMYFFCKALIKKLKLTPKEADRTLDEVDNMNGHEFEEFVAAVLLGCGYEIEEVTRKSGDYGADIIAVANDEKIAIQCKRYQKPVGVKAVQEVISAMKHYDCERAVVITNSTYTSQAFTLAMDNEVVQLWDRSDLIYLMEMSTKR